MRAADASLVARCRQGDVTAFEELYRQHSGRLYNLAWRMLGSPADAEDLLQDVFLQAFRKLESFKGESSLGTWLYRLAVNQCLDHLRSKASKMAHATSSLDDERRGVVAGDPAAPAELVLDRLDLERSLEHLPTGCREAFVLHDIEGFEHREVAELLGIAEGTSKSQVHKARMRLRELLRAARARDAAGLHHE